MRKACEFGVASTTISIAQQLQQSGMLQQLSAVVAGMTADLQTEKAALAAGGWDAASGDVQQFLTEDALQVRFAVLVQFRCLLLIFWEGKGLVGAQGLSDGWMWGPNGHAVAVMQLITAGLQYLSSITQYVLPGVRQSSQQLAATLVQHLQHSSQLAGAAGMQVTSVLMSVKPRLQPPLQQQGQSNEAGGWQQLLLSPHLLPCAAGMLVMHASYLGAAVATHCAREGHSSGSISSNASGSGSSSSSIPQPRQQHSRHRLGSRGGGGSGGGSGRSSSSGGEVNQTFTACQLQLLQLLGLAPEVANWSLQLIDINVLYRQLHLPLGVCTECCAASSRLLHSSSIASGVPEQQQQLWLFERQLWQLLPTVLLPCASSLLLPGASHPTQALGEALVHNLLLSSKMTAQQSTQLLQQHLRTLGSPSEPTLQAWPQEFLGGLLQLADRLLYQQPAMPAAAATGSTGNSTSTSESQPPMRAWCAWYLLQMLSDVARSSQTVADSPLATNFVEFVRALEATVRATSEAVQSGTISTRINTELSTVLNVVCLRALLPRDEQTYTTLPQYMGLCGPVALAQEQQQLYSLLSTLHKLHCCVHAGDQWSDAQHMAATCCLAAGYAAVGLLKVAEAAGAESAAAEQQSQSSIAAAAAVQQPAASCLPSLVIFGRCLLQWAGQLQQQAPELLSLGSGELSWDQHNSTLMYTEGAARVCIPVLRQGSAITPGECLESLAGTVSEWVGSIDPPALQQLTAAGCSPQQLQQQLAALLSAQQGLRQGLTDVSLAALVQQLQVTGAMLSSIAVPQFCNNTACANLSGPTEVRLVSGRSCVCAGCHTARYCGIACQRAAWKQHKPVCKALAAASATAARAQGS
jgi:uncharacterized membrane protein YgcG